MPSNAPVSIRRSAGFQEMSEPLAAPRTDACDVVALTLQVRDEGGADQAGCSSDGDTHVSSVRPALDNVGAAADAGSSLVEPRNRHETDHRDGGDSAVTRDYGCADERRLDVGVDTPESACNTRRRHSCAVAPTAAPPIAATPGPSSVPPPPPPGWSPAAPSDEPAGDGPIGERSTSSKKLLIGGVVAVLAVGAAGVFAVTQMSGGNEGGAASPEELGEAFMESLDQEDFLGAMDLLLPGERDTFKEPAQELVSELTRLEVLTDDAALDDLAGFEITLDERSVQVSHHQRRRHRQHHDVGRCHRHRQR